MKVLKVLGRVLLWSAAAIGVVVFVGFALFLTKCGGSHNLLC